MPNISENPQTPRRRKRSTTPRLASPYFRSSRHDESTTHNLDFSNAPEASNRKAHISKQLPLGSDLSVLLERLKKLKPLLIQGDFISFARIISTQLLLNFKSGSQAIPGRFSSQLPSSTRLQEKSPSQFSGRSSRSGQLLLILHKAWILSSACGKY